MSDKITRSIFTAIDSGSYQIAKSLCAQQLHKYPNSSYYYALSSYILLLNGERDEAISKSRALMAKTPSDPSALELLNLIFRRVGLHKESIEVYENACKKYPNLKLITAWFDLSMRNFDVLSIQKSSMLLVQHTPPDMSRSVKLNCSFNLFMAAESNKLPKQHKMLFPRLGLKMIESLKPFKSAQEVYIFVKLLSLNNKVEEVISQIVEFLKTEKDLELQIILISTLSQSQLWSTLYDTCYQLIFEEKFDDWFTWKHLIFAASNINKIDIIEPLARNYPASRNSKLALLEISKYDNNSSLSQNIESYMDLFASKSCCFADLKPYVHLVPESSVESMFQKRINGEDFQKALSSSKLNLNQTTLLVNYMKFKILLKPELLVSSDFVSEAIGYYKASEHLLKTKEKTDYFVGNDLLLCISNSIFKSSYKDDYLNSILKCIIILEKATKSDQHEFHLRLWLIRLYSLINCYHKAKLHFDVLKIRFIQNDTLSHYLLSDIGSSFPTMAVLKDLERAQDIYSHNQSETTYMLREAYDKGAFNKISGFIELGLRLNNSLTRYLNVLEMIKISRVIGEKLVYEQQYGILLKGFISKLDNDDREKDLDEKLSDNRDFDIMWDFGNLETDKEITELLFGPQRGQDYVTIMTSKEMLLANDLNVEPLDVSLSNIKRAESSAEFTGLEKWELSLLSNLITTINDKGSLNKFTQNFAAGLKSFTQTNDSLSLTLYHRLFTVLSISRSLKVIQKSYKLQISQSLNKEMSIFSKSISSEVSQMTSSLKDTHRESIAAHKVKVTSWFAEENQKYFNVSDSLIDDVFAELEQYPKFLNSI